MIIPPPFRNRPEAPFDTVAKAVEFYETSPEKVAAAMLEADNATTPGTLRSMQRAAARAAARNAYDAAILNVRAEYLHKDQAYAVAHESRECARIAAAEATWSAAIASILSAKVHGRIYRGKQRETMLATAPGVKQSAAHADPLKYDADSSLTVPAQINRDEEILPKAKAKEAVAAQRAGKAFVAPHSTNGPPVVPYPHRDISVTLQRNGDTSVTPHLNGNTSVTPQDSCDQPIMPHRDSEQRAGKGPTISPAIIRSANTLRNKRALRFALPYLRHL